MSEEQNSANETIKNDTSLESSSTEATDAVENNSSSESSSSEANNKFGAILALKDSNPKVFYGALGGIAFVILLLFFMGGSDDNMPVHQAKTIVAGQNYVIKSANAADPNAPAKLVSAPGSMAAFDDTEESDRSGCKLVPANTPVKAIQTQDAFGKAAAFVQVEIVSGECGGYKGWVLAVNLQ